MGKATGFMDYERVDKKALSVKSRIKNYKEFHTPLSEEEQKRQGARCMDCGVPFCQAGTMLMGMVSGCPLHNLVPDWNELVYQGNYKEAYERLVKTNAFPEFTSRVCPALCEKACTCGLHGDAVATKSNEYAIIESAYDKGFANAKKIDVRTGKKVAVIGSGPSGLSAADTLNKRGHEVTVFERSDKVGGLLRYGIPNMKLEKQVIDRKVSVMEEEGVTFMTSVDMGRNKKSMDMLKGFDAVILACGASNPRDIGAKGRDAKGIYFAVDFLKSTTMALDERGVKAVGEHISAKGKNVIVIGGGDTGNDCVGTSIRHGAKSVIQLEMLPEPPADRLPSNPWPEWPRTLKTDYGQEEAIELFGSDPRRYQTTVKEFVKDKDGNLANVVTVRLKSVKDEKTGRMSMVEVEGSEETLKCELVLIAAGFLGSEEYVRAAFEVEANERSNVKTDIGSYKTNASKVFAAGDMRRGQSLVVWAIREGLECAREVDEYLMGYTNISVQ